MSTVRSSSESNAASTGPQVCIANELRPVVSLHTTFNLESQEINLSKRTPSAEINQLAERLAMGGGRRGYSPEARSNHD